MKHLLKNLKINRLTIILLLIGIVFLPSAFSQNIAEPCEQKIYTFKGEKDVTLCETYTNVTYDIEIGVGTGITHSSQLGTSYTGNVYIKGDFNVDKSFAFIDCIVKIEPEVTITVLSPPSPRTGNLLSINNSKLFACEEMWDGIVLSTNATIHTSNGSIIEDAVIAIKADNVQYTILLIDNTTFNRNDVGILLSQSLSLLYGPTILSFDANTFSCTAPLNGSTNLISYAGIKTKDVPLIINPSNLSLANKFIGIQYGIFAEGVNSIISGTYFKFDNISKDGIYMDTGIINLLGSKFTNCQEKGVNITLAEDVEIRKCSFNYDETLTDPGAQNHDRHGIHVESFGVGSRCDVVGCDFVSNLTSDYKNVHGVFLQGGSVGSGTTINIHENSWLFSGCDQVGVSLEDAFPSDGSIEIYDNIFDNTTTFLCGLAGGGNWHTSRLRRQA